MADKVNIPVLGYSKVIPFDLVDRDQDQPRKVFPEKDAEDLKDSIKKNGIHNPNIYVRPHPEKEGRYMLVAGERRFRALRDLGLGEFELRVVDKKSSSPYIISLIENKNRLDLNQMDEAEAYAKCMAEEGISVVELGERIGEHPNDIYHALHLLKLAPEVKELIREGKLTKGGAHNLTQYRNLAKQIRYAQQLMAGENPPELDEQLTHTSEWGDARIVAALPKTAEGLIRRLLQFRRRGNPIPFIVKAFLDLSEAEQLEGWRHFTKATRENFTTQLRALIVNLQALESRMTTLPETKQNPFGKAVRSPAETAPQPKEAALPQVSKPVAPPKQTVSVAAPKTASLQRPLSAATIPVFVELVPPQEQKALKPKQSGELPTAVELETAQKLLSFIFVEMSEGRRGLLGKKSLSRALGNGGLHENATESSALKAFRIIRRYWRSSPDPMHPDVQKLIMSVSRKRHDMEKIAGSISFENFVNVVKARDNSPDPVDLSRL